MFSFKNEITVWEIEVLDLFKIILRKIGNWKELILPSF